MREVSFFKDKTEKCVIALGFFDAVHRGHVKVLDACVRLAKEKNVPAMAFTFECNPVEFVSGKDDKLVCTYKERIEKFSDIGIDFVLKAPCERSFFDIKPEEFLDKLVESFGVKGIVCGRDYRFGKFGEGCVDLLAQYCAVHDINLTILDELSERGQKIGSRDIKAYVKDGDMDRVNNLLGYKFSLSGTVMHGRGDGKKHLFPTINIEIPQEKVVPKRGVYFTRVSFMGETYKGITNVGSHPTMGDMNDNVETYVLDFDGDLYGKTVTVEFLAFLRDIKKFANVSELKEQIGKDVDMARSLKW